MFSRSPQLLQQPKMAQLVTEHLKKPKIRDPSQRLGSMNEGRALSRAIRPYLPFAWQYGMRWNLLTYGFKGLLMGLLFYSGKLMLYDPTKEEFYQQMPKYEFVYDREGNPVSMAPSRVAKQIHRVTERGQRIRDESVRAGGGW